MKQLLTPEAAAEQLAVSVKTVKNLLRSGKLRGVKVGNLWRLREEALEEYLKEPIHNIVFLNHLWSGPIPTEFDRVKAETAQEY